MGRPSSSSGLLLPRDTALAAVVPRTPDRRSARRATDQRRPTGLRSLRPSAWTPNHELVRRRRRACRRARRRTVRRGRMVGWGQVRCRLRRSDTGAIDRSRSRQRLPRRSLRELPGGYDALAPEDRQTAHLAEGDPAAAVETVAARKAEWGHLLRELPESFMDGRTPPEGDRWFFADPTRTRPWFAAIAESFRQGTIGYALEGRRRAPPVGFQPRRHRDSRPALPWRAGCRPAARAPRLLDPHNSLRRGQGLARCRTPGHLEALAGGSRICCAERALSPPRRARFARTAKFSGWNQTFRKPNACPGAGVRPVRASRALLHGHDGLGSEGIAPRLSSVRTHASCRAAASSPRAMPGSFLRDARPSVGPGARLLELSCQREQGSSPRLPGRRAERRSAFRRRRSRPAPRRRLTEVIPDRRRPAAAIRRERGSSRSGCLASSSATPAR